MDDWTLLKAYARDGDEKAFAVLVQRHIGLVYGAAYRQLGDAGVAEEVVQSVFAALAAKSTKLKSGGSMAAWLYRVACGKSIDRLRRDSARKRREQDFDAMNNEPPCTESDVNWCEIAPLLDDAMHTLKDDERTAVLMRVIEERPLKEVGEALGVSEDAARKRVARALDRLRLWFDKRGVNCTSSALGVMIGAFAAAPPAAGLIESTLRISLAQSAAAAGTTTATPTTILTTMASMKLPLFFGLLVGAAVPVSLDYFSDSKNKAKPPSIVSGPAPDFLLPTAESSGLMAEWERLRAEHGPNAGSMSAFYEVIAAIDDDFRRRAFRTALMAEWALVDPQGAVDYFEVKSEGKRIEDILSHWLKRDPAAAVAAMINGGKTTRGRIGGVLDEVAEVAPSELSALAPLVEARNVWDTRVRDAFAVAARKSVGSARKLASSMSGDVRKEALAGVAHAWAEFDGTAALQWAKSLEPSEDRARALRGLLIGWANSDPVSALDHLDLAPPGGGQSGMLNTETAEVVLRAAGGKDLDATLDWLGKNPDAITSNGYHGLTGPLGERFLNNVEGTLDLIRDHPGREVLQRTLGSILLNKGSGRKAEVWEWVKSQPNSKFVSQLKQEVFMAAAWQDPDKAMEWSADFLNDDSVPNNESWRVASRLLNNGLDVYRLEDLLEKTPESLHLDLLKVGFGQLENRDLTVWFERLEQLPADARPNAIGNLAAAQASVDPSGAIAWADQISDEERPSAYGGIAKAWAGADSYEASQWVAGLPPGISRDHAATALVEAVAKAEPDSAWTWAQTVVGSKQRAKALQTALRYLGGNAGNAVEQSDLPADEKTKLLEWAGENIK